MVQLISIVVMLAYFTVGCGVLFHGTTQDVFINTVPSGAKVAVSGQTVVSPTSVRLNRGDSHQFIATKEGYETSSAAVTSHVDGIAVALDIFVWLGLGLLIDCGLLGECLNCNQAPSR